jgi:hypothetical protein
LRAFQYSEIADDGHLILEEQYAELCDIPVLSSLLGKRFGFETKYGNGPKRLPDGPPVTELIATIYAKPDGTFECDRTAFDNILNRYPQLQQFIGTARVYETVKCLRHERNVAQISGAMKTQPPSIENFSTRSMRSFESSPLRATVAPETLARLGAELAERFSPERLFAEEILDGLTPLYLDTDATSVTDTWHYEISSALTTRPDLEPDAIMNAIGASLAETIDRSETSGSQFERHQAKGFRFLRDRIAASPISAARQTHPHPKVRDGGNPARINGPHSQPDAPPSFSIEPGTRALFQQGGQEQDKSTFASDDHSGPANNHVDELRNANPNGLSQL